jgi:hypothetical protein
MKHLRLWYLAAAVFALVLCSARACGPDFPSAVFVNTMLPDGDYGLFVAGHLGILQPDFHTRALAVAYRYLVDEPLSADEQKQAVAANDFFVNPSYTTYGEGEKQPPGFDAWLKARASIGAVDGYLPDAQLETSRTVPGSDYDSFTNCLDDAFATAARTLTEREAQHGAKDPGVLEWVRGQDAVFTNCGGDTQRPYFGPGAPPKPPVVRQPAKLSNALQWLAADRAYQIAAAQMYALQLDAAEKSFAAIAADKNSPWSHTARYVQARVYVRKAALLPAPKPDGAAQQQTASADERSAALRQAQQLLLSESRDPQMQTMQAAVQGLLDYVNARLEPTAQTVTLAARILTPGDPRLRQSLIDYTALHTPSGDTGDIALQPVASKATIAAQRALLQQEAASADSQRRAGADLVAWIDAMNGHDAANALAHWRHTPTLPWLVAAMTLARPTDDAAPALLDAAEKVPQQSPAGLDVRYQRLRLAPPTAETRAEIQQLLASLEAKMQPSGASKGTLLDPNASASAVNLLRELATVQAQTLETWLPNAARMASGYTSGDDPNPESVAAVDSDGNPRGGKVIDLCGNAAAHTWLFDADAAYVLNHDMPLTMLAQAAESSALPASPRFQLAQAVLARAILLDQPAIALRMAPILEGCRGAWKPVLDAYAAAKTPDEQHTTGLLVLMRFASTEPSVRQGEERRNGFATYDGFRQNWWCTAVPKLNETVDAMPAAWMPPGSDAAANEDDALPDGMMLAEKPRHIRAPATPSFLTPQELAQAQAETAKLATMQPAGAYFAHAALDWFHTHPADAHNADLLGEAFRALRNNCRNDPDYDGKGHGELTGPLERQVFDVLHQSYAGSVWAKRYTSWQ